MRAVVATGVCVVDLVLNLAAQPRTGALRISDIDTEGGQSMLFVGPAGDSLLGFSTTYPPRR